MKALNLCLLVCFIFSGCSGGGGDATDQTGVIVAAQVVSDVNQELAGLDQYQLTASEVDALFNEGVINLEQKQELLALAQ